MNGDSILVIVGRSHLPNCYALRDFLERSVVSFRWVELDGTGASDLDLGHLDDTQLPFCIFADGSRLQSASVEQVARCLGWVREPSVLPYDVSIYGAGPAGLSAAVYAASEGLRTVLIERDAIGGQAGSSSRIENYLGFPGGISGARLAERAREQAASFGAEILQIREGVNAQFDQCGRIEVNLANGQTIVARANICATGVEYRKLGLPEESSFLGAGLYYGAGASETSFCSGQTVVIVGGGNSAGQAALHLSTTAHRVLVLIRGNQPASSMSAYLLERLNKSPNVEIRTLASVTSLRGKGQLEEVDIVSGHDGSTETIIKAKVFVLVGGIPNTSWADGTLILRDPNDYLLTGPDLLTKGRPPEVWPLMRMPYHLETSVPGSFAAGDVRHGSTKRVAAAVGEGAMAVHLVHRFLEEDARS